MGDCGGSPSNRPGPSKATCSNSSCGSGRAGSRTGSATSTPLGSRRSASRSPQSSPELSLAFMNKLVEFMELSYQFFKNFKEESGGSERGSSYKMSDTSRMDQILKLLSQIEEKERELSALEAEYAAMNDSESGGGGGGAPCGTCGTGSATPPHNFTPPRAASSPRSASPSRPASSPRACSPARTCSPTRAASPSPRSASRATSPSPSASSSRSGSSVRPQSPSGVLYDTTTENKIFELISLIEKKERELAALEAEYAEMNANSRGDAGAGLSSSSLSAGGSGSSSRASGSSSRSGSPSRSRNPCGGSPSRSGTPPQPLTAPQQMYNLLDMPQRQQAPPLHHSTGINACDISCQPDWDYSNIQGGAPGSPSRGSSIGSPPRVVSPGSPCSRPASPGTPSRSASPGTPSRAGSPGTPSRAASPHSPRQGTFAYSPQAGPAAGNATFMQPVQKPPRGGIVPHSSGLYYCNKYCEPRWDVSSLHESYIDPPRDVTEYSHLDSTAADYEYASTSDYWPTTSVHESANRSGPSGAPCGSPCR